MRKLDLEALLEKNEQVDREVIKARQEKIGKSGSVKNKGGHIISPYSGRRVTVDDKMKWTTLRKLPTRQAS